MKIRLINQLQETECGLCCVAMVLNYFGDHVVVSDLTKNRKIGRDGVSISDLLTLFKKQGYETKCYKTNSNALQEMCKNSPSILYWDNNHFVVMAGFKRNHYIIYDPNSGKKHLTKEEFEEHYSGLCLITNLTNTSVYINDKKNRNEWQLYLNFFRKNLVDTLSVVIIATLYYAMIVSVPLFIKTIIDNVSKNGSSSVGKYLLVVTVILPVFLLIYWMRSRLVLHVNLKMDEETYSKIIKKILNIDYSFYLTHNSSDVLYRVALTRLNRDLLLDTLVQAVLDLGTIIVIGMQIFIASNRLFLILLICTGVLAFGLLSIKNKIVWENKAEITTATRLQSLEYEIISGMFTVKATAQEDYMNKELLTKYSNSIETYKKRSLFTIVYGSLTETLSLFGPIILFILAFSFMKNTGSNVASAVYVYSLAGIYFSNMASVFGGINTLGTIKNNLIRINEVLRQSGKSPKAEKKLGTINSIEFQNVCFSYDGQKGSVLRNVSFKVNKGSKTSIVGKTGSGKSTILGLMLGLYSPTSGKVLVNGIDINAIDTTEFRKSIGFVPQDAFIFNESIKDNVLMNRHASSNEIMNACSLSKVWNEIEKMPMKLETVLAEQGKNISGGQRQRIVMARALMSEPQFLILDEATSAIDTKTENEISHSLKKMGISEVNVAHRLSTIRNSDQIIVLKNGSVSGIGDHENLLTKCEAYKELYPQVEVRSNAS